MLTWNVYVSHNHAGCVVAPTYDHAYHEACRRWLGITSITPHDCQWLYE